MTPAPLGEHLTRRFHTASAISSRSRTTGMGYLTTHGNGNTPPDALYSYAVAMTGHLHSRLAVLLLPIAFLACGGPRQIDDVPIDLGRATAAISIVPTVDEGYFVPTQSVPARVLKLGSDRKLKWSFAVPFDPDVSVTISMVTPLRDGGALVCGGRRAGLPERRMLPGFLMRLDRDGKEVERLDPMDSRYSGKAFYNAMTCATWGDGYVMSTQESPDGSTAAFDRYDNSDVFVRRLTAEFSTIWETPLAVGGSIFPTPMAPKETPSGDLVFPGIGNIFVVDGSGKVKAHADMGDCRWIRTSAGNQSLMFGCVDGAEHPTPSVVEYDNSLNITNRVSLAEAVGSPLIAKLGDASYLMFGRGTNGAGVNSVHYDAAGRVLSRHKDADGFLGDVTVSSDGSAAILVKTVDINGLFAPATSIVRP